MLEISEGELNSLLADAQQQIADGRGVSAIETLCHGLAGIHARVGETQFREKVIPFCRQHEVFSWIQQDPYSRRAFEKPRGYAGDAIMLDYVYDQVPDSETSRLGCTVFAGTTGSSNGQSVLLRRQYLAGLIDEVAGSASERPRIASLAAGHLREADLTNCSSDARLDCWMAIDQDAHSLERIRSLYGQGPIETIHGSVAELIRNKLTIPPVDLFYSAGLFDYLNARLASKTIASMFERLRPGGELVVSNFTEQSAGRYFMDAFMDWRLVYRNEEKMLQLAADVSPQLISTQYCKTDELGNIIYLHLKRGPANTTLPPECNEISGFSITTELRIPEDWISVMVGGVEAFDHWQVTPMASSVGAEIGGRHIDYPHMIEHNGSLLIAFSGAKQTVEVLKLSLADLDQFFAKDRHGKE